MTSRTFGIEIELTGLTPQRAAHILNLVGLSAAAEGYNHTTRSHWKVVLDASVSRGCEVVSPPLSGEEGLEQVRTAITALDDAGAKINRSCGLHVHFDASGLAADEIRNLVARYARFENEIDAFMPQSRRSDNNRYCRSLHSLIQSAPFREARTLESLIRSQRSRYYKLNLQSFHVHGTIEFRQHGGTVNAPKALNWIQFLDAFIEASRTEATAPADQPRVSGKQATLVELMQQAGGASIEWLTEATEWQRHTVRAAITRLRQRGFTVVSERRRGTTIYRIEAAATTATADHLWRGQAPQVERFYRNRAAILAA